MSPSVPSVPRRRLLQAGGAGAVGLAAHQALGTSAGAAPERRLRFGRDGSFRIVQFNDTQDDQVIDPRTPQLISRVIETERPDLVVFNGDNITGGPTTRREVRRALDLAVGPVERAGVPWAATFGNHDEDSRPETGVDETDQLGWIRGYRHNVNPPGAAGITGTGNAALTIASSHRDRPAFAVWLVDGGRYAPDTIAGQDFEGYPDWDWIRGDQVGWYLAESQRLERTAGAPVPGLMFVHIPLWEFRFMWFASVDSRTDADHTRAVAKHAIRGERNEDECPGPFNSGMFSAILHRGDVRGVFSGHDHVNTYDGSYYGVRLGYGPGTGFAPYGLPGERRNHLRGARVFVLDESADDPVVDTYPVFARDLGIDVSPEPQTAR